MPVLRSLRARESPLFSVTLMTPLASIPLKEDHPRTLKMQHFNWFCLFGPGTGLAPSDGRVPEEM